MISTTLTLEQSSRFDEELSAIVDFIALDNPRRALEFFDKLIFKIKDIPHNPYIHRQRKSSHSENTRELIYKGYTIPFYIDSDAQKVIILGIFNQNIWE
ncbi:type II toxin-antitoxin system RelE/ParE family toxin [Sulfurimonas sp. SAG-AH-194-L11]|nr:type II toxin-antitoxin system RelE/ParE family toxin [Sulfurimonas sp. SAG-AH-194-L11]